MATYPIKMLRDEEGKPFVPLISIDSIKEIDGEGLEEKLDKKLEATNIKAGSQIEIKTEGNNVIISNAAEGMRLIDSLNTSTSGEGALDARQGKVLKESIPEIVNNLTTIDSKKALSAHQGYILAGRVAPTGGATGQVLKKASDSDYSFEWGDAADPNAIVGDGSIMKIVELSYKEYLELEAANQLQDDTEYHINDWNENERTYLTDDDIQKKIEDNVINNITSSESTKSLSAAQGKILNETKLSLSGGTLTGPLTFPGNLYWLTDQKYGIDMDNSDIIGINSLYMNDQASADEGIHFMRSNGNWDTLRAIDGGLYLNTNRTLDASNSGTLVQMATKADVEGTVIFNGQGSGNWLAQETAHSLDVSAYRFLLVHITALGVNGPTSRYSGNAVNQVIYIDLTTKTEKPICNVDGTYYYYGGTEIHPDMQFLFGITDDPGVFFSGVFVSEDKKKIFVGNAGYFVMGKSPVEVAYGSLYNGVSRIVGFK